jgi:hypothetical protein
MEQQPITDQAKRLFEQITEQESTKNFYLAGGTALAIQLNHRESIDLDFFSTKPFSVRKVSAELSKLGDLKIDRQEEGAIHGVLNDIKVTFLYYNYPLLFDFVKFQGGNLADERDIAAMKLDAISSRGSKKEFMGLFPNTVLVRNFSFFR